MCGLPTGIISRPDCTVAAVGWRRRNVWTCCVACRNLPELSQAIHREAVSDSAVSIQRRSVQSLVGELSDLRLALDARGAELLDWLLVRFQVENLKVLLRASIAKRQAESWPEHLVTLPRHLQLNSESMAAAESVAAFVSLLPRGVFRERFGPPLVRQRGLPRLFFLESALDRVYHEELVVRAGRVAGDGRAAVVAMVQQEADLFHLMLVGRGRFQHGLAVEELLPFHIDGTRIPGVRFATMLGDPDLRVAMRRALGRALDELPPERGGTETPAALEASQIEALAWKRFQRLANRAFRQGPIGPGAVFGYIGLRRVETANLITLSEGIRAGIEPDALRARMIPRGGWEVAHV